MKTPRALFLLILLSSQALANDSEALREVKEKRKALLENTVKFLEHDRGRHEFDPNDLFQARIRLYRFHRDHASEPKQKREFQEKIVKLRELQFRGLQRDLGLGIEGVSTLKVMRAEERYLAAKQRSLEIGVKERQSAPQGEGSKR